MNPTHSNVVTLNPDCGGPSARNRDHTAANVVPFRVRRGARKAPVPVAHSGNAVRQARDDTFTLGQLWSAIADDRIVNHYQPQYHFTTGETVAVEALVRVVEEDGNLLYPDRFIAQAEDSGMIVPLGRTVIRQACRDLAGWRRQGLTLDRVAINLSAHQLKVDTLLVSYVEKMLDVHGLDYSDLEFELTERQALERDGPAMQTLHTLAAEGARLALDDFGVGYSSVAYLSELDISTVKLDRGMVGRLPDNASTAGVTRHLLAMAEDLDIDVVAEGIETQAQNDYLAEAGCDLGQGFLVARPMAEAALIDFLSP
jgi:EAL domain-containing protein (putative c-di-GMP-specific phosphodiesterase class I)